MSGAGGKSRIPNKNLNNWSSEVATEALDVFVPLVSDERVLVCLLVLCRAVLRHRQTVFVLPECRSDVLPSNVFYTSASDRLGSQKGYPQRRWFKIAPL